MRTLIGKAVLVLLTLACAQNAFSFHKGEIRRLARKLDEGTYDMSRKALESCNCQHKDRYDRMILLLMRTSALAGKAATFRKVVDKYERPILAKAVDNMLQTAEKVDDSVEHPCCARPRILNDWREIKHILNMLDRELSGRRRPEPRRHSLRRRYSRRDVVRYDVIRRGYRDRESDVYEINIEFSDVTSDAEVRATLEDALVDNYEKRKDAYNSVLVRGYYIYPNAKLGEVYWEPGDSPRYTVVERRKTEDFIDLLLRVFE